MKKYIQIYIFGWVMLYTYNDKEFLKHINSLPKETIENSKIQFCTPCRPHYILYWE